jgi:hypothetical protein
LNVDKRGKPVLLNSNETNFMSFATNNKVCINLNTGYDNRTEERELKFKVLPSSVSQTVLLQNCYFKYPRLEISTAILY